MFTWRVCGGAVTWQLDVYLESVWGWCNMAVRCLLGECVGVL